MASRSICMDCSGEPNIYTERSQIDNESLDISWQTFIFQKFVVARVWDVTFGLNQRW